jgi:putative peptidoglycan lipid II flippase
MLALVLLAKPLVATLFQHGAFTAHDADMAALSLAALAFGLPAFALIKVLAPAFYSRQDTRTPVRAGVIAMLASMILNVVFVGALYFAWRDPAAVDAGWLAALAGVPGLHTGLALASACAGYVNLLLLWRALRRDRVFTAQPGWTRHLLRLGIACAAMVAVLVAGSLFWPEWNGLPVATRITRLAALITAGGSAFALVLFAAGFRMRDLRAG